VNLQRLLIQKMEHRIIVGTVAFLAMLAIVGWIAINEPGRMAAFSRQYSGRSIERGAILFSNNCSTCHGIDGLGVIGRAPALNTPYLFGHDFLADISLELRTLGFEYDAEGTTDVRKAEIDARRAELEAEQATRVAQMQTALDAQGDYDPTAPGRLQNLGWGGTVRNYVYTTLVHGRPNSATYWPQPMGAWAQIAGGPLRNDQLEDLTNYILNWDKSEEWTIADLNRVRQFPRTPVDGAQFAGLTGEPTVGTDVAAILTEISTLQGNIQSGETLYSTLACAGCHNGGAVGPATEGTWTRASELRLQDPAVQALLPELTAQAYVVHSIVLPYEYLVAPYGPVMPATFGTTLSYQQMADLLIYLQSQDQPIQ